MWLVMAPSGAAMRLEGTAGWLRWHGAGGAKTRVRSG